MLNDGINLNFSQPIIHIQTYPASLYRALTCVIRREISKICISDMSCILSTGDFLRVIMCVDCRSTVITSANVSVNSELF